MARNPRISVPLTPRELERLEKLAGREQKTVAQIAAILIVGGVEREIQMQAHARAGHHPSMEVAWMEQARIDARNAWDTPGLDLITAGRWLDAPAEARRAENFLVMLTTWLNDPRPSLIKGEPPRLADIALQMRLGGDYRAAVLLAEGLSDTPGADGQPIGGRTTSDKGTLLEVAPAAGNGGPDEQ